VHALRGLFAGGGDPMTMENCAPTVWNVLINKSMKFRQFSGSSAVNVRRPNTGRRPRLARLARGRATWRLATLGVAPALILTVTRLAPRHRYVYKSNINANVVASQCRNVIVDHDHRVNGVVVLQYKLQL
jgi:hypothetical protein